MSNYRTIPGLLRNQIPFTGNSMSAHIDSDGTYVVVSYATPIAWAKDGQVVTNDRRYSRTTSRHQNLVRENLR